MCMPPSDSGKDPAVNKKRLDSLIPFSILTSETTGTNAEFIAPSANKRLNKLGNLNATKKASATKLAPSESAINKSETY